MANEWTEIGERLQGLGLKLKLHYEQSGPSEMPDAFNKLGTALEDLFKTAGNAVKDEAVRTDLKDVGHMLADAVTNNLNRATTEVRDWINKDKPEAPKEEPPKSE
jgi:hypothetical protein